MGEFEPGERIVLRSPDSDVELRQLIPADAEDRFALIDGEDNRAHLRQFGEPIGDRYATVGEVRDEITNPPDPSVTSFGIWHYPDGGTEAEMVGGMDLVPMGEEIGTGVGMATIRSWIGLAKTGHGYAAEARGALVDYAFSVLGYGMIFSKVREGNLASRASVERTGFQYRSTSPAGIMTYELRRPPQAT